MKRILITGGNGKLASKVATMLAKENYDIVRVDIQPNRQNLPGEFIRGDICRSEDLVKAMKDIDIVLHVAGGHDEDPYAPANFTLNCLGTFNVLEQAGRADVKKLVFTGSDSVLGFIFHNNPIPIHYFPVDERHPCLPQDTYGMSKYLSEQMCKSYQLRCDMQIICLRFCWIWPGDAYYDSISDIRNETIYTFHANSTKYSLNARRLWGFVDLRDAADATFRACKYEGSKFEVFFITGDGTFSEIPSLELIAQYFPEVTALDKTYFKRDAFASLYDNRKAKKLLAWQPQWSWRNH